MTLIKIGLWLIDDLLYLVYLMRHFVLRIEVSLAGYYKVMRNVHGALRASQTCRIKHL